MASTYSTNLKLELIASGEQSGTWGNSTNNNVGTLIEQSIVGSGSVVFTADADMSVSISDGATSAARCVVLSVTSTTSLTATRNLTVPTINKPYVVYNNTSGSQSIVVKTSAGTGITIPNGKRRAIYADATNVVDYINDLPSTVTFAGTFLPVAQGGTGTTTSTGTGNNVLSTSPTLVTPVLGAATATSLTATSLTTTTINGNTLTTGTYTLSGAAGKTLTFSNSFTLAGTDATTMTFPATTGTVGVLNNQGNWTKQQYFGSFTLTDGATVSWDAAAAQVATLTLGGNRTMAAPTNLANGSFYSIYIIQDGTGSRTIAWNSVFKFISAAAPTLTTTAAGKDFINFRSDGTNLYEIGRSLSVG